MDFKFLEIGTRIAIGQFDATIIEYDVIDGFSGLFPVYVVRFDTGETEPVHHTDITGLIYDNPMPIEVIEGRKAYRAEHGDAAPDPLEEIEIETAEMGDVDDYDQLRIERGEFETENYQLKQQLAAVTAERDALKNQMAEIAKTVRLFIRKEREHANSEYLWHEGLLAILTMTGE